MRQLFSTKLRIIIVVAVLLTAGLAVIAGINSIEDLLKFPWDREPVAPITDEERDELLAEMDAYNAALSAKQDG